MDISTVSRVVNGKYVQTEFGVYELKYFFSEGLTTESGEEVSNKEVKALIDRIIAAEDKSRPLSDQAIADMLEKQGFNIARRTVTKYREQLNIPVARLRKQIVLT
jgi:RNA polymerase sigma-54 factor